MKLEGNVFDITAMAHGAATVYATKHIDELTEKGEKYTLDDIVQAYVSAYCKAVSFTPGYLNTLIRSVE